MDHVYHLAANVGGIGFIENNKAVTVHDNTLINTRMLEAARRNGASRLLCTSSTCIYPGYLQESPDVTRSSSQTPTRPMPRTAPAGRSPWPSSR
jgi:GDP-D-mannose 3',5'-epimerase